MSDKQIEKFDKEIQEAKNPEELRDVMARYDAYLNDERVLSQAEKINQSRAALGVTAAEDNKESE